MKTQNGKSMQNGQREIRWTLSGQSEKASRRRRRTQVLKDEEEFSRKTRKGRQSHNGMK